MALDGPAGTDDEIDGRGDVDAAGRLGVLPLELSPASPLVVSTDGRLGGAAPHAAESGRGCLSLLKDPLPPLPAKEPRAGGT
jgi:hypothetical protein